MINTYVNWWGASGAPYAFTPYYIYEALPDAAGVYILAKRTSGALAPSNHLVPLYVGETESFRDRLANQGVSHPGFDRAMALGAEIVCVHFEVLSSRRLSIETDLRHALRPPANWQSVPPLAS